MASQPKPSISSLNNHHAPRANRTSRGRAFGRWQAQGHRDRAEPRPLGKDALLVSADEESRSRSAVETEDSAFQDFDGDDGCKCDMDVSPVLCEFEAH